MIFFKSLIMFCLQGLSVKNYRILQGYRDYLYLQGEKNEHVKTDTSDNVQVNKTSGYDNRYIANETEIQKQKYNIYKNFEKKNLLNILQNDNLSIDYKLYILSLDNNEIQSSNIKSGGLMKDFDFELNL